MGPIDLTTSNWVTATIPCSEETPCTPESAKMTLTFHPVPENPCQSAFLNFTLYTQADYTELMKSNAIDMQKNDQTGDFSNEPIVLLTQPTTTPLTIIIELSRYSRTANPSTASVTLKVGEYIQSGDVVDANNAFTANDYSLSSPASARYVIGPIVSQESTPSTPYDNNIFLDFDLGWNPWDKLKYDRLVVFPEGFSLLNTDEYSYNCNFAGQFVSSVRVFEFDPQNKPGYYVLELGNLLELTSKNNATFGTYTTLSLQCIFPIPTEVKTPLNKHIGYTLQFDNKPPTPSPDDVENVDGSDGARDNMNQIDHTVVDPLSTSSSASSTSPETSFKTMHENPTLFYGLDDEQSVAMMRVFQIKPQSKVDLLGQFRTASLQSRFVEIRDRTVDSLQDPHLLQRQLNRQEKHAKHKQENGEFNDATLTNQLNEPKNRYMSYYYIGLPYETTSSLEATKETIMKLKQWSKMSISITGLEISLDDSLEYVHFYVNCVHQSTTHNTIVRFHPVLYGHFSTSNLFLRGPGKKTLQVENPTVFNGSTTPWDKWHQNAFSENPSIADPTLPFCDQWSFDIAIGVYSENIDPEKWQEAGENAVTVRVQNLMIDTEDFYTFNDWISAYDHDSLETSKVPGHSNQLQLSKVSLVNNKINQQNFFGFGITSSTAEEELPYYSFEMLLDTTGIFPTPQPFKVMQNIQERQENGMVPNDEERKTMSFNLETMSGNLKFKFPLVEKDGDDSLINPISCTIRYKSKSTAQIVEKKIETVFASDLTVQFDMIEPPYDNGIPYDTKDIKFVCENLFLQPFTKDTKLDHDHTNIAVKLNDITLTGSVFGPSYSPDQHNRRSWAKVFGLFLLWTLLVLVLLALILFITNYFTKGGVVLVWRTRIRPFIGFYCPCCSVCGITAATHAPNRNYEINGSSPNVNKNTKGTDLDDIDEGPSSGYGSYGSYQHNGRGIN